MCVALEYLPINTVVESGLMIMENVHRMRIQCYFSITLSRNG